MSKPAFLEVPIEELRPNPWNVNSVSPENEEKLIASVKRLGLYEPIKVRQVAGVDGYEILGGEHRWNVAQHLGHTTIQIANLGYIDDQTAKEVMLADNNRYGTDDVVMLAELLSELGAEVDVSSFLPYTDTDLKAIFSSVDIDLDELEDDDLPEVSDEKPEPEITRPPKTHALMRFKVPNTDAEKLTALIAKTQKSCGFTASDELTNAGDALVHLLFGAAE